MVISCQHLERVYVYMFSASLVKLWCCSLWSYLHRIATAAVWSDDHAPYSFATMCATRLDDAQIDLLYQRGMSEDPGTST